MSEYRIRPYQESDKAAVAELQQYLWGGDVALNAAYFRWKYERNPYIQEPLLYLALRGDKVVGMRGVFGSRWIRPDGMTPITLPHADDLVIHPAHRGGGLHRLIMVEALRDLERRGFDYVINLSAIPVTAIASLRMDWRDGGSFRPLRRRTRKKILLDRSSEVLRKLPGLWRHADRLAKLGWLRPPRLFADTVSKTSSVDARTADALISDDALAAMAAFTAPAPREQVLRHVHDTQYLRWRYSNPLCEYRCLLRDSGRSNGYVVLQRALGKNADPLRVNIADWEANDSTTRLSMIDEILADPHCHELWCWGTTVADDVEHALRRRGFSDAPRHRELNRQTSLLIRTLRAAAGGQDYVSFGTRLDDVRNWHVRMINSMVC